MKNKCVQCGVEFAAKYKTKRYCSTRCKGAFYYILHGGKHLYFKTCPLCKKQFRPSKTKQKFCDRKCAVIGRTGKTRRDSNEKYNSQCMECGKPMYIRPSRLKKTKKICCSQVCHSNSKRKRYAGAKNPNFQNVPLKKCENCGKRFRSYNKSRKYCGPLCSHPVAPSETIANLKKGYQAEIWCKNELQKQGYHATLSAASRGEYDVIGISNDEILLIQVKRTKSTLPARIFPKKAVEKLIAAPAPKSDLIKKQIWTWLDGSGWTVKNV